MLRNLIAQLRQMPGVGPRSAERIALWIVRAQNDQPDQIARAINDTRQAIHPCELCGFFTTGEICEICADSSRSVELLCVVEQPTDILPLEKRALSVADTILLEEEFRLSIMLVPRIFGSRNCSNVWIEKGFLRLFLRFPPMSKVKRPQITLSIF